MARLGETLRRRQEKRHFRGEVADPEIRFLRRGKPGRWEQPAHESLSSRATLVEVPLTGLSFILRTNGRGLQRVIADVNRVLRG